MNSSAFQAEWLLLMEVPDLNALSGKTADDAAHQHKTDTPKAGVNADIRHAFPLEERIHSDNGQAEKESGKDSMKGAMPEGAEFLPVNFHRCFCPHHSGSLGISGLKLIGHNRKYAVLVNHQELQHKRGHYAEYIRENENSRHRAFQLIFAQARAFHPYFSEQGGMIIDKTNEHRHQCGQ